MPYDRVLDDVRAAGVGTHELHRLAKGGRIVLDHRDQAPDGAGIAVLSRTHQVVHISESHDSLLRRVLLGTFDLFTAAGPPRPLPGIRRQTSGRPATRADFAATTLVGVRLCQG